MSACWELVSLAAFDSFSASFMQMRMMMKPIKSLICIRGIHAVVSLEQHPLLLC